MSRCILKGHGRCEGSISGEHYISENVLKKLGDGKTVYVGGFPWIRNKTLKQIGLSSLVTQSFCRHHNSQFSNVDQEAGKFIDWVKAIQTDFDGLPEVTFLTGKIMERWFLKSLCGTVLADRDFAGEIPEIWKLLLLGRSWPAKWGLYVPVERNDRALRNEISVTVIGECMTSVEGAYFNFCDITFYLSLSDKNTYFADSQYKPSRIRFAKFDGTTRSLHFNWKRAHSDGVTFLQAGASTKIELQWRGWDLEPLSKKKAPSS